MKIFKRILLFIVIAIVLVVYFNYPKLEVASGFATKNLGSSAFVADRSMAFTTATDNNMLPIDIVNSTIDSSKNFVIANALGTFPKKAIYRKGLGCVLVAEDYDESTPYLSPKRDKIVNDSLPYPYGILPQKDTVFGNVDYALLNNAVDSAFNEDNKTRAVLVIYKNQIIAEKYAKGFDKNAKQQGWSMTKSLTSTMYGVLQSKGKLNVNDKAPVELWENDKRSQITLNNLLQMNSGLEWSEDYFSISDATKMLFMSKDMGSKQAEKPLIGKPNESWYYSSGTTNLLSKILRSYYPNHQAYLNAWYSDLVDKIGMHSMVIEADQVGTYVGSSYCWATPRDWAKLGLLYLHKGNWNGMQIFDESWVKYATTPTNSSNGNYGAQIWLNVGGVEYPDVPEDVFSFHGFSGQRVFIIPSKDLVIVRMGLKSMNHNKMLKEILSAIL